MILTVAAPIVDQFANRSLFTGAPLIRPHKRRCSPKYHTRAPRDGEAIGADHGAFPGCAIDPSAMKTRLSAGLRVR